MPSLSLTGTPAVCVPARDEAQRLPRLLKTLAEQQFREPQCRLRVVVVANNCRDGTAEIVRTMQKASAFSDLDIRLIEKEFSAAEAHAGSARRTALDAGADWLDADGIEQGVLLTTDADARVPPDWIAANLAALRHAEIVGGRLVIDAEAPAEPRLAGLNARIESYWASVRTLEERFDPQPHDPAPRHGDHTGASLSLSASLYRAVGGLPVLPLGEDNALVALVQDHGGRLRHCPAVCVHVSDRVVGRAEGGMAREMARRGAVTRGEQSYDLPNAAHWQAFIERRADLRRLWHADRSGLEPRLRALGLDSADLRTIAPEACRNDIAFVERASRRLEAKAAPAVLVELDQALAEFGTLLGPAEDAA